jgi:antitoxin component YwqK of YwqJK toxin-antitoxin module
MALTEYKTDTEHYCKDEDGKLQGEYKWWWNSDGKLQKHCFFKDGKKHGEYKWWDRNGQLRRHCFYNNGKKVIDFLKNPALYPTTDEDKTVFVLKYTSARFL